jgi:hypothetical protein
MDAKHFDRLARSLTALRTRRGLLIWLAALLPAGGLLARLSESGAARGRQHGRHRGHHPGKKKVNRKGKRKDQGKSRTQDCPDATIQCFKPDVDGNCGRVVGSIGPVGTCYNFPSCCPCGHPDPAYWIDRCNETFPDECVGRCSPDDGLSSLLRCISCVNSP